MTVSARADSRESVFPGARPLRPDEFDILVGRKPDLARLVREIEANDIVELLARSGVGKTSLLQAGLLPALDRLGSLAVQFSDWASIAAAGRTPLERYQAAIDAALAADNRPRPSADSPEEYLEKLDRMYRHSLVLVFDQVEELFRDDQLLGEQFIDAVKAAWRGGLRCKQVLSMRSEFAAELHSLEDEIPKSRWECFLLEPVGLEAVPDLVTFPLRRANLLKPEEVADQDAVSELVGLFSRAVGSPTSTERIERGRRIGLLHFQALLWVVGKELSLLEGGSLTGADVRRVLTDVLPRDSADALNDALFRYFSDRLNGIADRAEEAGEHGREVAVVIAAMAPHLSSAGYKLIRDTDELATLALPGLADLGYSEARVMRAARLARTSADPAKDLARLLEHVGSGGFFGPDPTAGRLRGEQPVVVLAALVRQFELALRWLTEAEIARMTPTADGGRVIALIHDGFGVSLNAWARSVQRDWEIRTRSLVALSGVQVFPDQAEAQGDSSTPESVKIEGSLGSRRELANLVWLGCYVGAQFRHIVLRGCDFRGSVFSACHFEEVEFVDCNLWGSLFINSTFRSVTIRSSSGSQPIISGTVIKFGEISDLRFDGVSGYGLFLDSVAGGPWELKGCHLQHVSFEHAADPTKGPIGPGRIERSTIEHLTLSARSNGMVTLTGINETVTYVSNALSEPGRLVPITPH